MVQLQCHLIVKTFMRPIKNGKNRTQFFELDAFLDREMKLVGARQSLNAFEIPFAHSTPGTYTVL